MNFDLDDSQRQFVDTVERFLGPIDIAARRREREEANRYPASRWQTLAELGLLALAAPADVGGLDGSRIDLALVAEALGKGLAIDPWLENGVLPIRLAALAGDTALVEQLTSGRVRAAVAFAEPQRRFALDALVEGADGTVSGHKTLVLGGMAADLLLVTTNDGLYSVEAAAAGVSRRGYIVVDGSQAAEISFKRAVGRRLGLSLEAMMPAIGDARLLAAAEMVGLAQRLFDDTLDYLKQRRQFGVAIGSFQALQHRMVDCYADLELARSLMLRAALDGTDRRATTAGVKAQIGASATRIAREAVQMHGGMGQTDELAVGHAMKRVMLLDKLFGDADDGLLEFAKAA